MAGLKEIKTRIESVSETRKITNAMYLIASAKLRRAKSDLDRTRPYFTALQSEVKRIFRTVDRGNSPYFYPDSPNRKLTGTFGYLIITSDRGLAGAYNQNVLREADRLLHEHCDARIYAVGECGRRYFAGRGMPPVEEFRYAAQNPTFGRAREMADFLLTDYLSGKIQKIYIVYSDFSAGNSMPRSVRLLPLHQAQFGHPEGERPINENFEFQPSLSTVLENLMPSYIAGFLYSALVDSYCSEQNARMQAMESANRNAEKMMSELSREYHRMRQRAITEEITEIAGGAKCRQKKTESEEEVSV